MNKFTAYNARTGTTVVVEAVDAAAALVKAQEHWKVRGKKSAWMVSIQG